METWLVLIGPLAGALVGAVAAIGGGAWQERQREARGAMIAARLLTHQLRVAQQAIEGADADDKKTWPRFIFDVPHETLRPLPAALTYTEWGQVEEAIARIDALLVRHEQAKEDRADSRVRVNFGLPFEEDIQKMREAAQAAATARAVLQPLASGESHTAIDPQRLMSGGGT